MACKEFIMEGVSADMINRIIQALLNAGAIIEDDNPWHIVIEDKGIALTAEWVETTNTLKIKITRKPFWAPCRIVIKKLKEEIEKARDPDNNDDIIDFNLNIDT